MWVLPVGGNKCGSVRISLVVFAGLLVVLLWLQSPPCALLGASVSSSRSLRLCTGSDLCRPGAHCSPLCHRFIWRTFQSRPAGNSPPPCSAPFWEALSLSLPIPIPPSVACAHAHTQKRPDSLFVNLPIGCLPNPPCYQLSFYPSE